MSSINILGSYSGIDMSVIDQLVEAERAKGTKFTRQKQEIEREQNAWKDINSRLDTLFQKVDALAEKETFETRTVHSNIKDSTSLAVTAGEDAAVGQYRVQIQQLAESTRLTGSRLDVASIYDDLDVEGAFTFTVDGIDGAEKQTFTIDIAAEDSLKDISVKINEATNAETDDSGIRASIVDNHLVLTDTNMGERTITVTGAGAEQIGFAEGEAVLDKGQLAEFEIDGLQITRNSNTVDDVIEGLTFQLTNVHEGSESEVITIAADIEKTTEAVQDFVDQYNSVMSFIDDQMDVGDPSLEDNKTGALTGDGTLMRLQSNLRSLITQNLQGDFSGDFKNIEDLGITLDRDGVATLDTEAFQSALREDPANVARFFYQQEVVPGTVDESSGEVTKTKFEKRGMSELLKNFIDTYISSTSGIISSKNETYDRMIEDINQQIDVFNDRVDRKRERYIQQFTALDIAMMQAESQLSYMYSQLGIETG